MPPERKRGDGLERRPPVGTAREREISADDAGPCHFWVPRLSQTGWRHRLPRHPCGFFMTAGCAGQPDRARLVALSGDNADRR